MRRFLPALALATLTACPTYDGYQSVATEDGMLAPDEFAKYGPQQAIAVAIGREFGHAHDGRSVEALTRQSEAAVTYARSFPQVRRVIADTLGHRLVVTFTNGWSAQVTPITDGKRGSETPGLPGGE